MKNLCIIPCRSVQFGDSRLPTISELPMDRLIVRGFPAKVEICVFVCFVLEDGEPLGRRQVDLFLLVNGSRRDVAVIDLPFDRKRMEGVASQFTIEISNAGTLWFCVSQKGASDAPAWPLSVVQGDPKVDWTPM